MPNYIIIPAHLGSKRLPRKPLLKIGSRELLYLTVEQARNCKNVKEVVVATDSREVEGFCTRESIQVIFTGDAFNGTHRVAIAARYLVQPEIVVNWQVDYPFADYTSVDAGIAFTQHHKQICTLYYQEKDMKEALDFNNVKCIINSKFEAYAGA